MKVVLECTKGVTINTSLYEDDYYEFNVGEEVLADFTKQGVNLLINKCWLYSFKYSFTEECFKVKGQ